MGLLQKQMIKASNLYNKSDDLQTEIKKKKENAVTKLNKFLQTNKHILKESYLDNTQNSNYKTCNNKSFELLRNDIHQKEKEQQDREKRINKKAIFLYERAIEEYNTLISKKKILISDKKKICLFTE